MASMSIELIGVILIVGLIGGLLGAVATIFWNRRKTDNKEASEDDNKSEDNEKPRQEARRYFLLNETGNVLISTSLSPEGRLPDATLELFSEALAHLASVFYVVSRANKPFSLYNYTILKRALEFEPTFIRVSSDESPSDEMASDEMLSGLEQQDQKRVMAKGLRSEVKNHTLSAEQDKQSWLDQQVKHTSSALGMEQNPANINKLRAIHTQMREEAKRIHVKREEAVLKAAKGGATLMASKPSDENFMEIGFITLYCECLMGVSLVSVKLAHAHYENYLSKEPQSMAQDTYLFISPSQLKKVTGDVNTMPRIDIPV